MATIATAEVQVIADTSRFIPDLRRKLRTALAGVGDDLGQRIESQISARLGRPLENLMTRLGRNAGTQFNRALTDRLNNLDRDLGGAGERAGRSFTRRFRAEADFQQLTQEWARDAVEGTAWSVAGQRLAQRFGNAFNTEIGRLSFAPSPNPITIRRSQDFVDNLINTMVQRAQNRSGDVARAFEEGLSELRDSQRAQQFVTDLINRMTDTASDGAEQAGQSFVDSYLAGIESRQRQALLRVRQNGGNLALAFSQGVQRGSAQAAADAADSLANSFENSFSNRLRLVFARVLDFDDLFDRSRPSIDRATQALRGFGDALTNIARGITITPLQNLGNLFSDLTTNMASAAAMALFFLGAIDQLAGLLFAIPAALALVSAGVATVIVGFQGMGAAFAAAGDDAEAFEDAISGLAPSAQAVAREFRALNDDFDRIRLDAQEALWSELAGSITAVADNLLGPLHDGLVLASGALGELIAGIGDFLAETETADTVTAIFESLAAIFESLADEIQPFLGGIRTLINEFLPGLEAIEDVIDGVGTAFQRWADEVTTGDLLSGISPAQRAFEEALQVLDQLWRITLNVASAVESVFDAARSNGSGFLDLIEEISSELAAAFAAPEGQDTLRGFLADLVDIAEVVTDVLGAVFEQFPKIADPIADIAENVGPDLMDFINELGDAFAVFLEEAGPGFEEIASALGELDLQDIANNLGDAFRNVAPLLHELTEAFGDIVEFITIIVRTLSFIPRGIAEFARAFVFLQEIFDELRNFDGIISGIGDFFADLGPRISDGFNDALEATGEFFSDFGARVADGFDDTVQDITDIGAQIGRGFMNIVEGIGTFFTETLPGWVREGTNLALETTIEWGIALFQFFRDLFNDLISSAADFVLGLQENISGGLETASSFITGFTENIGTIWDTFWLQIGNAATLSLQGLGLDVSGSLDGLRSTFSGWQTGISEGWSSFWSGVRTTAQNALSGARDIISGILSSIRSTISGWIDDIRSRWSSLWSGLSSFVSNGLAAVRSVASSALDGIRGVFSSFASRIREIWNGLIDFLSGIADSIRSIANRISGYVSDAISAAQSLTSIDLNPFANGGIVYGPTPALVGEAGPEVIIPLTRPQRAAELVEQSGLLSILAGRGVVAAPAAAASTSSGPAVEMHVHPLNSDPEQVARQAFRMVERRLGGRGLERTR